jgi:multicomponent Na+:H+ antiporter subunit D
MAATPYPDIDISAAMVTVPTALGDWLVVVPIAVPIVVGAILLMLRHSPRTQAPLTLAALGLVIFAEIFLLGRVFADGPLVMTMGGWLPPFGISFVADALGVILALTGAVVAFVCALVGIEDIDADGRRYGFYPFLLLLTAGVSGSFLTGDIFNLYVWFEIFLISSFGLIVLGSTPTQLDGAVKYAVLNLVATTLFLLTTGLLYGVFGTLNMADIARKAPELRDTGPLMTLAVLYLVAFGMKAAAFPLSFWLPASYHTPRIVVAALFGGLLTKVGVYALLRTLVMLFPIERAAIAELVGWVAIATMILGVLGALAQSDIRRILGFIVVSGIGVMLAGLALGTDAGISGTVVYAVHSMLVMTALYILAGMMGRLGGSYSLHQLGGLYRGYPLLAAIALVLVLSVAGLPPGSGLWPKVMLVKASIESGAGLLAFSILATGLLTSLALGRVFALSFWRPAQAATGEAAASASRLGYMSLVLLLLPILWIGLYPEPVIRIADEATAVLLDPSRYVGAVFPEGGAE